MLKRVGGWAEVKGRECEHLLDCGGWDAPVRVAATVLEYGIWLLHTSMGYGCPVGAERYAYTVAINGHGESARSRSTETHHVGVWGHGRWRPSAGGLASTVRKGKDA